MTKTINTMLKSKRFFAFSIELVVYLIGVYFFKCDPLQYAEGLALIFSPYLIAESIRKSKTETI